jgi:hypothetical protein
VEEMKGERDSVSNTTVVLSLSCSALYCTADNAREVRTEERDEQNSAT